MEKVLELLEGQQAIMGALAGKGGSSIKAVGNKEAALVNTAGLLFGAGGVFSTPGLEPDVITAHVRPHGLLAELPHFPSVIEQPRYATITGFTGTTGNEPANPCSDAPSGYMKGCNLTAQFGRVQRDTNTIEWDKVMLQLRGGITTDLVLRGRLLGLDKMKPSELSEADVLNIVTMAEMVGVGVQLERLNSRLLWRGNPANNNIGGGYKEPPGLDRQIATGQVDAETNIACAALDSDVKSFARSPVDGTARSIVEYMGMLEFYLRYNAERMGLDPVEWVFVMRPELWFTLSEVWPCQYNTSRCATAVIGAGSSVFIDGRENVAQRDAMRAGRYIDVNGNRYRVITDTGIQENTNINDANLLPGQYASSIYMLPLSITGGFPVTYIEHVDYAAGASDTALLRGLERFWTDGGMYSWAVEQVKWCYKLSAKTEWRVVLRTPQLAGRIDLVRYQPLQHLRSPDPSDPYFADGGVSLRGAPATSHVW
jgi:hypothetical protein